MRWSAIIKQIRVTKGLKQQALASLLGVSQSAVSRWERRLHQFVAIGVFLRGISTYSRGGFLSAGVLGFIFKALMAAFSPRSSHTGRGSIRHMYMFT